MPTIAVEPELYKRVEQVALEQKTSVDAILADVVRQYLWELDRHKISQETDRYYRRWSELKNQYLGQYIAFHNGQVVDHDSDLQLLRQRIRQHFVQTPVMITRVEASLDQPLIRRGFRMEAPGL